MRPCSLVIKNLSKFLTMVWLTCVDDTEDHIRRSYIAIIGIGQNYPSNTKITIYYSLLIHSIANIVKNSTQHTMSQKISPGILQRHCPGIIIYDIEGLQGAVI